MKLLKKEEVSHNTAVKRKKLHVLRLKRAYSFQNSILTVYEADFSKHRNKDVAEKCRQVWQSIPSQLAKENKKFVYNVVKKRKSGAGVYISVSVKTPASSA